MRTTLTLEADVARALKAAAEKKKLPFKQLVNHTLRLGLGLEKNKPRPRFVVRPYHGGLMPGIDSRKLNQLADQLEDEAALAKMLT